MHHHLQCAALHGLEGNAHAYRSASMLAPMLPRRDTKCESRIQSLSSGCVAKTLSKWSNEICVDDVLWAHRNCNSEHTIAHHVHCETGLSWNMRAWYEEFHAHRNTHRMKCKSVQLIQHDSIHRASGALPEHHRAPGVPQELKEHNTPRILHM